MYKKLITAVLAITLTVGGLGLPADVIGGVADGIAASASAGSYYNDDYYDNRYGDYYYVVLDDVTVEITKYSGNDAKIEIPSKIDGKKSYKYW